VENLPRKCWCRFWCRLEATGNTPSGQSPFGPRCRVGDLHRFIVWLMVEWPRYLLTPAIGTPEMTALEAKVCLKQCHVKSLMPAFSRAGSNQ
jgi:hypothetical protein